VGDGFKIEGSVNCPVNISEMTVHIKENFKARTFDDSWGDTVSQISGGSPREGIRPSCSE
jgi:hypothetical protein